MKNGWWGRPLLPKNLGQQTPVVAKLLILNRYLLVAPHPPIGLLYRVNTCFQGYMRE